VARSRARAWQPLIAAIVISAMDPEDIRARIADCPVQVVQLRKPIAAEDLLAVVRRLCPMAA
jgi:hypothetical protein